MCLGRKIIIRLAPAGCQSLYAQLRAHGRVIQIMNIIVNGESRTVPDGMTLAELLRHLQLPAGRLAVEHNRELAPRAAWATRTLAPDDHIEIVQFVGGG